MGKKKPFTETGGVELDRYRRTDSRHSSNNGIDPSSKDSKWLQDIIAKNKKAKALYALEHGQGQHF